MFLLGLALHDYAIAGAQFKWKVPSKNRLMSRANVVIFRLLYLCFVLRMQTCMRMYDNVCKITIA